MHLDFVPKEDHSDPSSAKLVVFNFRELPFIARRIYWLTDFREGATRGNHAHKNLRQAMIMLKGSIDLKLCFGTESFEFRFSDKDDCLLIPPGYWREMKNASTDAVMMVIADFEYLEEDYIRNWQEYLSWHSELS